MTTVLEKAIADLYEAFASEPKPLTIEGCDCCITKDEIAVLLSKPLRSITPAEMQVYAEHVFLTVGSESDFKYFLPRIFEILITENAWWPEVEVMGKAISRGWNSFSAIQQNAVLSFFNAVLKKLIEQKDGWEIDGWICAIGRGVPNLQPYLDLLEKNPDALIAFYEENSEALAKGHLRNAFWDKESSNEKLLLDWFQSDRIKNLINTTYGLK